LTFKENIPAYYLRSAPRARFYSRISTHPACSTAHPFVLVSKAISGGGQTSLKGLGLKCSPPPRKKKNLVKIEMFPQKLVFPDGKTFHQQNADALRLQPGHGDEATQLGKELKGSWRAARLHRTLRPRLRAGSKDPAPPGASRERDADRLGRAKMSAQHPASSTLRSLRRWPSPQPHRHPHHRVMSHRGADTRGRCSPRAASGRLRQAEGSGRPRG